MTLKERFYGAYEPVLTMSPYILCRRSMTSGV